MESKERRRRIREEEKNKFQSVFAPISCGNLNLLRCIPNVCVPVCVYYAHEIKHIMYNPE